jgi:FK506-binding protein 4/5
MFKQILFLSIFLMSSSEIQSFLPYSGLTTHTRSLPILLSIAKTTHNHHHEGPWINLLDYGSDANPSATCPVKKLLLEQGHGEIPKLGTEVELDYVGRLVGGSQIHWTVDDVVECWLKSQQGLYDILSQPFREHKIDGRVLLDENVFDEAFVVQVLGVGDNKILCKKIVMAAKRLRKLVEEYSEDSEFDSSMSRGKTYRFVLGTGKVIKAIELLISTMRTGEKATVICRADYGYGSEGYRTSNGEVVVPPFATLCFDIKLLSVT